VNSIENRNVPDGEGKVQRQQQAESLPARIERTNWMRRFIASSVSTTDAACLQVVAGFLN
jgi:hypothetical protein